MWVSEYCFKSLPVKSWQYHERSKPKVGKMWLPYSYRMIWKILYSVQYHRRHWKHLALQKLIELYYAQTRWQTSKAARIRTNSFWVWSHNRIESVIGAGNSRSVLVWTTSDGIGLIRSDMKWDISSISQGRHVTRGWASFIVHLYQSWYW